MRRKHSFHLWLLVVVRCFAIYVVACYLWLSLSMIAGKLAGLTDDACRPRPSAAIYAPFFVPAEIAMSVAAAMHPAEGSVDAARAVADPIAMAVSVMICWLLTVIGAPRHRKLLLPEEPVFEQWR